MLLRTLSGISGNAGIKHFIRIIGHNVYGGHFHKYHTVMLNIVMHLNQWSEILRFAQDDE